MKNNQSVKTKLLSFVLASVTAAGPMPLAFGQTTSPTPVSTPGATGNLSYNALCGPNNDAGNTSNTTASDQITTYCTQAGISRTTAQYQTADEILELAAGGTLAAMTFIPAAQPACEAVSLSTSAASLGIDIIQGIQTKNLASVMMTGMISAGAIGAVVMKTGVSAVGNLSVFNNVGGATNNNKPAACAIDSVLAFAQGAMAGITASQAKTAEQSALASVQSLENTAGSSGFNGGNPPTTPGTPPSGGTAGAPVPAANSACGATQAACLNPNSPASQALKANPTLAKAIQAATGMTPQALVNGYSGDGSSGSAAGYVGNAMGMTPAGTSALQKSVDSAGEIAQENGYTQAGFIASNNKAPASSSGDVDFNKLMSGMLKQLNPSASDKKGEDASALVFRQLDLMSPDKISTNPGISLFARASYRYTKKSPDLGVPSVMTASVPEAPTVATSSLSYGAPSGLSLPPQPSLPVMPLGVPPQIGNTGPTDANAVRAPASAVNRIKGI